MVFGVSESNGARPICGSIESKKVAGGHLGMMALSRVTFASAGLSCSRMQAASMLLWSGRPCKQAILSGLTPLHKGKGKGKGRSLVIAPLSRHGHLRGAQVHGAHQAASHRPCGSCLLLRPP